MQRFHFDVLGSTSDHAKRLILDHPGKVLLISADEQTAGRGRSGRQWDSPKGGAWFSLVWPISDRSVNYGVVPLVAGLAVLRVIRELVEPSDPGLSPQARSSRMELKWPNDVLLDGKKVAGILCESVASEETGHAVVIGIGINANNAVPITGLIKRACPPTSIWPAIRRQVNIGRLINDCVDKILHAIRAVQSDGFSMRAHREIAEHLAWVGDRVTLAVGERSIEGVLCGIDPQGRVEIETRRGVQRFDAGEVFRVTRFDPTTPDRTGSCAADA